MKLMIMALALMLMGTGCMLIPDEKIEPEADLISVDDSLSVSDSLSSWDGLDETKKEKVVDEFFFKLLDVETNIASGRFTFVTNTPFAIPKKFLGADFVGDPINSYEIHIYRNSSYVAYDNCKKLIEKSCNRTLTNNKTGKTSIEYYNCSYYESYVCNPHAAWRLEEVEEMKSGDVVEYSVKWNASVDSMAVDIQPYVNITTKLVGGISKPVKLRQEKWLWFNPSWLKSKSQCVTTYTNDEFVFWLWENDTDFWGNGYEASLRQLSNNITEIPYANGTDDASGLWGIWSQANGSAGEHCYTFYYDNGVADYPDYSATTPFTYAVDYRGATTGGIALFDIWDSFEDNQADGDYGWGAGYAYALGNVTNNTVYVDGAFSQQGETTRSLATKFKAGTTDTIYMAYFTYTDMTSPVDDWWTYHGSNPVAQSGAMEDMGYLTADEWGYYSGGWSSTGKAVSDSAWDKHFITVDNSASTWDLCVNDVCSWSGLSLYDTTFTNVTGFVTTSSTSAVNLDLIIVSKNSFNVSATRPVYGHRGVEESAPSVEEEAADAVATIIRIITEGFA